MAMRIVISKSLGLAFGLSNSERQQLKNPKKWIFVFFFGIIFSYLLDPFLTLIKVDQIPEPWNIGVISLLAWIFVLFLYPDNLPW